MNTIDVVRGGLIVSCQAYPGEPLRDPAIMSKVAQSAVRGGAVGIRANGLADVRRIAGDLDVPLIGLVKVGSEGVFITPTMSDALAVAAAGAQIVATDGTGRARPDGSTLAGVAERLHAETDTLVMADVSTLDEGLAAAAAGADLVSTTLSGYTPQSRRGRGPDLELVRRLVDALGIPVVAEGRIHTPGQAAEARAAGAHCVVVGTAITHPTTITGWFSDALAVDDRDRIADGQPGNEDG